MCVSYNLHLCKTFPAFCGSSAREEQGSPEHFCSSQEQVSYACKNIDELPRPGNKHGTAVGSLGEASVRSLAGALPWRTRVPPGSESQTSTHSTERKPVLCAFREDF